MIKPWFLACFYPVFMNVSRRLIIFINLVAIVSLEILDTGTASFP